MDPLFITLTLIGAITLLVGAVLSYRVGRKQQYTARDEGSKAVAKHFILLNPILIAYVATVIAVALFAYIFYMYFFQ